MKFLCLFTCLLVFSTIAQIGGSVNESATSDVLTENSNVKSEVLSDYGEVNILIPPQKSQSGWYPWKVTNYQNLANQGEQEEVCEETSSLENLPDDLFTQEQRLQGAIILHFIGAIYFFTLLAVVCNDYFLPTIECICQDLEISPDVGAATFMAVAGTIPELFTNIISTFVTFSDMGLGAILGTLFFNTLGVAAIAALAAQKPVQLNWYPLFRDCTILSINVAMLTAMSWDGVIEWFEALILVIGAVLYWVIMFQNDKIKRFVCYYIEERWRCCRRTSYDLDDEAAVGKSKKSTEPVTQTTTPSIETPSIISTPKLDPVPDTKKPKYEEPKKHRKSLWRIPRGDPLMTVWWFYTWPIKALLTCLVPSPKTYRKLYPLTFIMCIIIIGANSFMVFWLIATIGYTFGIPEVVMGFTILAWGSCLPEGVACVLIVRKGNGGVGVSNSLGSNSMAILFSLGIPWLLRTLVDGGWNYVNSGVYIYAHGISFVIMALIPAAILLFLMLYIFRFRLKKISGLVIFAVYSVFVVLAVLLELNIIFPTDRC